MNKLKREDTNSMGKILYGSAIVLLVQGQTLIAAATFFISIMTILLSLKKEHEENEAYSAYKYLVAFIHELSLGLWPAAFVELILGKYVAMAIIILIAVALSQTIKFITIEEGKQDVQ